MFISIKYLHSKRIVVLRDTCFGVIQIRKTITCELNEYFIYSVMKAYSKRKIHPISNIIRCLKQLDRNYGADLYLTVDLANALMKKHSPSVNFDQYVPLLKKVYIPQILKRQNYNTEI